MALLWAFFSFLGALPFYLHYSLGGNTIFDMNAALFESISGITTTGATLIEDFEVLPKSLLIFFIKKAYY